MLGLVLPEGEDADAAFALAHHDANAHLRGTKAPPFDRIAGGAGQRRRVHVRGHWVYRDKSGHFVSRRRWRRSHGRSGRYGRSWIAGYYYTRGSTTAAGELPPLAARAGVYDTLDEALAAFPVVTHGDPLKGAALDRALKALGLDPLTVTVQGAFSRTEGGPLELWEADGPAIGGLTLTIFTGLLDQITRDWRQHNSSPPVILVSRVGVAPFDDS